MSSLLSPHLQHMPCSNVLVRKFSFLIPCLLLLCNGASAQMPAAIDPIPPEYTLPPDSLFLPNITTVTFHPDVINPGHFCLDPVEEPLTLNLTPSLITPSTTLITDTGLVSFLNAHHV